MAANGDTAMWVAALAAIAAACASEPLPAKRTRGGGADGARADLPGVVIEDGAPRGAAKLFAKASGDAAAPCLVEPEPGTLFPKNWLPPRFSWIAGAGANLFELHVTVDNQAKDLVVYTTATSWTMPKDVWDALREHSADVPMTVAVRGARYEGGRLHDVTATNGGDLRIAPVDAPGSIVFWSIGSAEQSLLKGFTVGEPGVVDVLRGDSVPAKGQGARTCIGCHTSTPDGKYVAVAWEGAGGSATGVDIARIERGTTAGPAPDYVTATATATLAEGYPMLSTFSRARWAPGDRLMLTNDGPDLVWVDLEAKAPASARGVLGKVGDPNLRRLGPTWSRDGGAIVYMSGTLGENPFELVGPSDLYVMPFADKAGATAASPAEPLRGASDPSRAEYYPALSPDDAWVAFTALPDNGSLYDNPKAEIFLVPRAGGERVRLEANDPPSCQPKRSPGLTNSWPKWAPEVKEHEGRRYYFIVFSSRRHRLTERPQLYVAPVQVDASGGVTTFPAVYLRNQESVPDWKQWGNHTPAWDVFAIEPVIVK